MISTYPAEGARHDYQGGVAAYTKNLVHAIAGNQPQHDIIVIANQIKGKCVYRETDNVKVIRCWHKGLRFYKEILATARKENLDVVHLHQELRLYGEIYTSFVLLYLLWRLRRQGVKTVITIHGIVAKKLINAKFIKENNTSFPPFVVRAGFHIIFCGMCRLADQIIVHENFFREVLISDYKAKPSKVDVVNLGVEDLVPVLTCEQARKKLKIKKKRVILFFGYVTSYKSPELLLRAFEQYIKQDKDCLLIIAGGKHPGLMDERKYLNRYHALQRHARRIGRENVWWYGFVPEDEIEEVIMAADLLVFPYTVALSTSAPLSLALSYQKPFLLSEQIGTLFSEKSIVFKSDQEDLTRAIKQFFNRKDCFSAFVSKVREERLLKNIAAKTSKLYIKLINHSAW
ncbi:MAG TPA: glycosyltransferase [bacterium]|nr:glycosyltransferase [bacterium]